MKKYLVFIVFVSLFLNGYSRSYRHYNEHEHKMIFGLGAASAVVYDITERSSHIGLHLHTLRTITDHFGLGFGYELIKEDNFQHTVTLLGQYKLNEYLAFNIGPGIELPQSENEKAALMLHFEANSGFDIGRGIHIGPMIGLGIGKSEKHVSVGVHVGFHY